MHSQRLRNLLIQILHRLPHVEALRPHAASLMSLLLTLLRLENEENAILCMKVIIDLHRTYSRPPLPSATSQPANPEQPDPTVQKIAASVDEFLEIVAELFKGMGLVVEDTFTMKGGTVGGARDSGTPTAAVAAPPPIEGEGASGGPIKYAPAMKSFKLLQDCPAAIVFIFQTYRQLVDKAITIFVPLVFDVSCRAQHYKLGSKLTARATPQFLQLQAEPQRRKHASMEQGKSWVGTCPEIPMSKRSAFQDMVMAQTKVSLRAHCLRLARLLKSTAQTMSFLAYMLRVSATALSSYLNVLPDIAVRLMKDCPSEAVAMKRDLVVATRHILQSELRSSFLGQIDTLLDDHVLIGNSVTGYESLRPLAYSMLADLIHHVRAELSVQQLARIVHTYSANVHDPTLAAAIQTMCSKLLLNLIDPISSKEPVEATKILQRIQVAFVSKMEAMAEVRDEWTKWAKPREPLPHVLNRIEELEEQRKEREKEEKDKPEAMAIEAAPDADAEAKKDGEDVMDVDKKDGDVESGKAVEKAKEPIPPLPELDDVDIERAKPMRKAMVMVDPGPDPVKGEQTTFTSCRSAV